MDATTAVTINTAAASTRAGSTASEMADKNMNSAPEIKTRKFAREWKKPFLIAFRDNRSALVSAVVSTCIFGLLIIAAPQESRVIELAWHLMPVLAWAYWAVCLLMDARHLKETEAMKCH